MTDRIPGAPGRCKAVVTGAELQKLQTGEEFAITLRRDDQPIKEGTPYSKAAVLPDTVAAKLCPGLQDPTPGDAFAALQSQKADTVRKGIGSKVVLPDAIYTPLKGLKIYGKTTDGKLTGENGSVTVNVMGKNIADVRKFSTDEIKTPSSAAKLTNSYGTTISATTGNTITVTQSQWPSSETGYANGFFYVGFYCPLKAGDVVTISFNYKATTNPLNYSNINCFLNNANQGVKTLKNEDTGLYYYTETISEASQSNSGWNYLEIRVAGKSGVFSNFQIEYGSAYTGFEEYKEPQTLVVPTIAGSQVGLAGDGEVFDEIDFTNGLLIHRVLEEKQYPLTETVLENYAKLHTYTPTTVIENDAGAEMEITYYTTTTAVQMVHSPADKDKLFSIDEHGCTILVERDVVVSPVMQKIQTVEKQFSTFKNGFADRVIYREAADGWTYNVWESGTVECWGEVSTGAYGSDVETDHCNIFSLLPAYYAHFDYVQVTVLAADYNNPGSNTDSITNMVMSVFNIDADAERERLVVRFGILSGGNYGLLMQSVSNVRLSVHVIGTAA